MASLQNEENKKIFEQQKMLEQSILAPGETNWFKVLTSVGFVVRLAIVVVVMLVCALIILNITLNPNSNSWYNKIHKPDWMPDSIVTVIVFSFLSFTLAWSWYRLSEMAKGYSYLSFAINTLFVVILALQFCWTLLLYRSENIQAGKYLVCFFLGFVAVLFFFSVWYTGFSDVSLYSFLYVAWLSLVTAYTFNLHELEKEYKILGIAKEGTSLYKKKIKMEQVYGIFVNEKGEKTEVAADEQE